MKALFGGIYPNAKPAKQGNLREFSRSDLSPEQSRRGQPVDARYPASSVQKGRLTANRKFPASGNFSGNFFTAFEKPRFYRVFLHPKRALQGIWQGISDLACLDIRVLILAAIAQRLRRQFLPQRRAT